MKRMKRLAERIRDWMTEPIRLELIQESQMIQVFDLINEIRDDLRDLDWEIDALRYEIHESLETLSNKNSDFTRVTRG